MSWLQNTFSGFISWHKRYFIYWLILAVGMCGILLYEGRNVGLQASQWFWLLLITTDVAILCIWIVFWGDDNEEAT